MVQALSISGSTVAVVTVVLLVRWLIKVHDKVNKIAERVAKLEGWVENEEGRRE